MHILIVDDEADLRDLVSESLKYAGFDTTSVSNGSKALKLLELVASNAHNDDNELFELYNEIYPNRDEINTPTYEEFAGEQNSNNPLSSENLAKRASELIDKTTTKDLPKHYDLVILDEMMPELSGVATLTKMREYDINTPVIFLSAKSALGTKINAFNAGSDDYILKPFDIEELIARVNVVINRNQNNNNDNIHLNSHTENGTNYGDNNYKEQNIITIDELIIDLNTQDVKVNDETVDLTPTQFELLLLLASNRGSLLSKEEIFDAIWSSNTTEDETSDPTIVETYVCAIRGRLKKKGVDNIIETKRGRGYLIR